ncbi:DUF6333 family protein, partial [Streptomyces platensis]|uniref:DUF6333 family protein n=1 Tax=Streptomyces platensis TaxID=58346 RepID=UPI0020121928
MEVHCGAEHTEDLVWLPDGTMFHACGWPGDEPFVVAGDPQADDRPRYRSAASGELLSDAELAQVGED